MKHILAGRTLEQITIRAGLQSSDNPFIVIKSGEDNHMWSLLPGWRLAAQTADRLDAIQHWHLQVEQKNIGLELQRQAQRLFAARRLLKRTDNFKIRLRL